MTASRSIPVILTMKKVPRVGVFVRDPPPGDRSPDTGEACEVRPARSARRAFIAATFRIWTTRPRRGDRSIVLVPGSRCRKCGVPPFPYASRVRSIPWNRSSEGGRQGLVVTGDHSPPRPSRCLDRVEGEDRDVFPGTGTGGRRRDALVRRGHGVQGVPAGGPPRPVPRETSRSSPSTRSRTSRRPRGMAPVTTNAPCPPAFGCSGSTGSSGTRGSVREGGTPHYDIREPGYKYNLTDLHAAVGVVQMRKVAAMTPRRADLAGRYLARLSGVPGIDLPEAVPYEHATRGTFSSSDHRMDRDAVIGALAERNVGVGLHFPPCHLLSYVRERSGPEGGLPDTERAGKDRLPPLFPGMSDADVDYVCERSGRSFREGAHDLRRRPRLQRGEELLLLMDRLETGAAEDGAVVRNHLRRRRQPGQLPRGAERVSSAAPASGPRTHPELRTARGDHLRIFRSSVGISSLRSTRTCRTLRGDPRHRARDGRGELRSRRDGPGDAERLDPAEVPSRIVNAMTRRITGIRMSDWGACCAGTGARWWTAWWRARSTPRSSRPWRPSSRNG